MPEALDRIHQRYLQLAGWTSAIRQRVFLQLGLHGLGRVLEVGSGTGAITSDLREASSGVVIGLDRDTRSNAYAQARNRRGAFVTGLGEQLPFPPASFDLSCCHFLLLWVTEPLAVLLEMKRVTRPGGGVLCLAEPDYGGRVDYPEGLVELGNAQEAALRAQGANTLVGRCLRALLHQAGLADVQAGVLGGEWADTDPFIEDQQDLEWHTLAEDLSGRVSTRLLRKMESEHARAQADGSLVLFVPTFYAWGKCPPHGP